VLPIGAVNHRVGLADEFGNFGFRHAEVDQSEV
jgi:hypothetical protein